MATTPPVESQLERQARYARESDEMFSRIKQFAVGAAKAVTTDIPGFVADVADKLAGQTKTLGEAKRSDQFFEAMTGVKSTGSNAETLGGFMGPEGVLKSIIAPVFLLKSANVAESLVKNADLLASKGASGKQIWDATGLYKSPESDIWKAVLPDTGAKLNRDMFDIAMPSYVSSVEFGPPTPLVQPKARAFTGDPQTLADTLLHPELYATEAGKFLPDIKVRRELFGTYSGAFNTNAQTMYLGLNPTPLAHEIALHETQHAVQGNTAMSFGGNSTMFFQDPGKFSKAKSAAEELTTAAKKKFDEKYDDVKIDLEDPNSPSVQFTRKHIPNYGTRPLASWAIAEKPEMLKKLTAKQRSDYFKVQDAEYNSKILNSLDSTAFKLYTRIAGEAEARLVEKQFKLGDYTTYPLDLYDVPLDKLIKDPSAYPKLDRSEPIQKLMDDVLDKAIQAQQAKIAAKNNP